MRIGETAGEYTDEWVDGRATRERPEPTTAIDETEMKMKMVMEMRLTRKKTNEARSAKGGEQGSE